MALKFGSPRYHKYSNSNDVDVEYPIFEGSKEVGAYDPEDGYLYVDYGEEIGTTEDIENLVLERFGVKPRRVDIESISR